MPPRAPLVRADGVRGTYSGQRGSVGVIDAFDEFSGDEYSRKLYTQLAKIPVVGEGIDRMTKPEKERRLRIARNAIKIIQEGFRNWVKMFRTERERWKVTSRGYLSYTSVRPRDKIAEEARRVSVEQHGWHAPLNRRYQALGAPHLDLGRKPDWGEWAVRKAGAKDGATGVVDGEKNIFVGHGESVQGAVPKFGFAYYQTFMNDPKADLKVTVEAIFGDPDLFMSRTDQHPDQVNHTWSSSDLGADIIEVPTTDANFGLGQYYIAVYGGGGGTECRFTISVTSKRPLAGAGANAVLLEGGRANQVGLAAGQADSRRKLVAAGHNARALMAQSGGTHGGATPEQRLAAVRGLAPSAASNLGGELGTSEAEIALKLGAVLRVSIDFALAARQGGPAAITAEWLCQVLAHCTGYRQLASRAPLTTQGEPASYVAIVISGELQVAANPDPNPNPNPNPNPEPQPQPQP